MSTGVYTKTAGDLIRASLRDAGIVAAQLPIQAVDFALAQATLNDVLASWQALGINLWRETEALLPLNASQTEYSLGAGGAHCFTSYNYSTASSAISAAAVSIPMVSSAGMTIGDFIGIELADGTRQWSNIVSIPDSTHVTITAGGLTSDANSGASIYAYTTKIDRPLRILDVRCATTFTGDEIISTQASRQRYYQTPNKTNTGSIVSEWYYSPQLTNGKLSVWSPAQNCVTLLRFTFVKPQYVPEDQSDLVLIPSEWFLPLKWALASELGVTYAIDVNRLVTIQQKAASSLELALSNDSEDEYFSIQPG
jgi:hypothetical protein